MDGSPMNGLPHDTLLLIFSSLPLRDIIACRSVCKSFNQTLTSSSFMYLISTRPPLHLLALRPHHHHHHHRFHASFHPSLHVYDPHHSKWLRFSLDFLPFRSLHPVASAGGLVYLWVESTNSIDSYKSLVVCNPLTRQYRVLPQLGSAWSRHGSVLVDSVNRVMVLSELAALYFSGSSNKWLKFSSNLPSKPRSPILISNSVYALCDVGSPWRSRWKLFTCSLNNSSDHRHNWVCLEKEEWGDIFDIVKRPRLVRGSGSNTILMIGGLKSTLSLNPSCSTILILRLDLDSLEWEEATRMPVDMYRCFQESTKFKVFGGGDKVCFSAKRVGRLALWDGGEGWRWIDEMPGNGDGLSRGFVFEAQLNALP
ncbi:SKP1-interacting partner 15 [Tripterygium wilfordii]|uniref:SKP1-interacting partner 15 n=1 Tax=Tripterygium wilfordii TaxID=458696 RepID=A0A7J7BVR0_TRIWF|nr:SKP1-interacting partner 15-like [Tripterygium wilfordii]XP_038697002.1 SKP1-interacting partner 15-like [Tripterygium wilfordii]XP_038697003.1 SKP1-interacting partner 15-like [Tripterygium wilfordii]XP_038697004.1 SKP1-interacting partner 15-like [Tripterygium wilfordii]XP_038697005.1 SKP1-interacting partner 15-like [Tripterygium wilfordii]XP_038697006.1 SKP1-interacting partner 15-like [Tripterygium wilfordii]KAF5725636.1 SKP1-interacting partner 15 [Tripterygium wilfordii]